MKRIHCLRIDAEAEAFEPLFAEADAKGVRLGWLDWRPEPIPSAPESSPKGPSGAWRRVEVGPHRIESSKRLAGKAVFRDVLRESFRGCLVVLVRGEVDFPRLTTVGDGRFEVEAKTVRWSLGAGELVERLGRPDPWLEAKAMLSTPSTA